MSQDECSTEARMCTRRKPKEGTTRSGATAPTERHCADKAPVRQQGATHQREQDKISILRGSQNIPPGHLDSPQDMLETL